MSRGVRVFEVHFVARLKDCQQVAMKLRLQPGAWGRGGSTTRSTMDRIISIAAISPFA